MIAVKVAPGSAARSLNMPAIRRCALEDIGKNSVKPCRIPRKIASNKEIYLFPHLP